MEIPGVEADNPPSENALGVYLHNLPVLQGTWGNSSLEAVRAAVRPGDTRFGRGNFGDRQSLRLVSSALEYTRACVMPFP
jgi:hypothetical protein